MGACLIGTHIGVGIRVRPKPAIEDFVPIADFRTASQGSHYWSCYTDPAKAPSLLHGRFRKHNEWLNISCDVDAPCPLTSSFDGPITMLAKVHFLVPFEIILPLDAEYKIYGYEEDGYGIYVDVPMVSGKQRAFDSPEDVQINGKQAIHADVISVVFQKDQFERGISSEIDPPISLIQKSLNKFLERLRYVSKAPQVRPLEFDNSQWHIQYLNNDGSELEQTEGLVRARFTRRFSLSFLGCDPGLWDLLFTLPEGFEPPAWHTLLVDSRGALPHVGTALVLAATALEIFIAEQLDQLVKRTTIPPELWDWINGRGNWQKEPSVEEQYDDLLKIMTGHSLKEDNVLWEGLKNLRSARNSFVHEGVAKLGRKKLSANDVLPMIGRAEEIVSKIREWIPEECRWPMIEHTINFQMSKIIASSSNPPLNTDVPPSGGAPVG